MSSPDDHNLLPLYNRIYIYINQAETRCSGHCAVEIQDFTLNCSLRRDQAAFVKTVGKFVVSNLHYRFKM